MLPLKSYLSSNKKRGVKQLLHLEKKGFRSQKAGIFGRSHTEKSSKQSPIQTNRVQNASQSKLSNEWQVRYDPSLSEYYYVNLKDNIVQFDSPLEVVRH